MTMMLQVEVSRQWTRRERLMLVKRLAQVMQNAARNDDTELDPGRIDDLAGLLIRIADAPATHLENYRSSIAESLSLQAPPAPRPRAPPRPR